MIKVKLDELAKKLHKTILEMAEETKLNRNSLSALVNNKVDGIKFPTLEKLCTTYNVKIEDLLELKIANHGKQQRDIYRQEADMVPFFCFYPAVNSTQYAYTISNKKYKFGDLDVYLKNDYALIYWDSLQILAEAFYNEYGSSKTRFNNLYLEYSRNVRDLEELYLNANEKTMVSLDNKELKNYLERLKEICLKFWSTSLFIDSFDPGKDQEEIKKIKEKYGLDLEEISVLTTPVKMTFSNERELHLLKLAEMAMKQKISANAKNKLAKFVRTEPAVEKYKKEFDYYKSNYFLVNHITDDEIQNEIGRYLKNKKLFGTEMDRLTNYESVQENKINNVLKKHLLPENPLWFFNLLTYWRENRKKGLLMSVHILDMILASLANKTGISKKTLLYAIPDEAGAILDGSIDEQNLAKRRNNMLISFRDDGYKIIIGKEAETIKNELEEIRLAKDRGNIISGQVASQGYAKGVARIILGVEDFGKFKEGEIIIAGMTRPEFVPLMKKAAAIVTNEGGITCHAAIVSRELGKPCIIGTKNATSLIKDGDLIEVRAHHGTVRIIERK